MSTLLKFAVVRPRVMARPLVVRSALFAVPTVILCCGAYIEAVVVGIVPLDLAAALGADFIGFQFCSTFRHFHSSHRGNTTLYPCGRAPTGHPPQLLQVLS